MSKEINHFKGDFDEVLRNGSYFIPSAGIIEAWDFSSIYPIVNEYLYEQKEFLPSRDGKVKELLDVRTHIKSPYYRCVGGFGRNINIFFLLAEAMWIALGRKDVEFLTIFNKNMAKYSDDGNCFHAPYGYRMRHYGIQSESVYKNEGSRGLDQVLESIRLLEENPNTRQVVMSIWNPEFDLGFVTKDMPCNDMVMFKIRDGYLITTIQNRSNDLHLGLPTNIFQFGFLTEIISCCLGIELGTQTHNSQSLHIYEWNETAKEMYDNVKGGMNNTLYRYCKYIKMDFDFHNITAVNKFKEVEVCLDTILENLVVINSGGQENENIEHVKDFSNWFYYVYQILKIYVLYKNRIVEKTDDEKDELRVQSIYAIDEVEKEFNRVIDNKDEFFRWDISTLAKNFFYRRLKNKGLFPLSEDESYLGTL